MLFLASMGETKLSHDIFLILSLAFWGHWGWMTLRFNSDQFFSKFIAHSEKLAANLEKVR